MDQEETLEWLTGAFSNKRLGAIIKAVKVANPDKTIVLTGSGSALSASGFPSADSAEEAEGAFACRIQESGSAFMAVFAKPDKATQQIGGSNQDWVGLSYSLDGSQIGFASLGYLRSANAVTVASGVVYVPKASAISLLSVAMAGTAKEAYADQSANAYSENPIASKVILKALANITSGITVDAQGNVTILGNAQVDGSLNANGCTLNSLSVTEGMDVGGPFTMGYGTLSETGTSAGSSWDYSGNFTVEGWIKQNKWEYDSGTSTPLALSAAAISAGYKIPYQHIRASNGKLNIVVEIAAVNPTSAMKTYNLIDGNISLPTEIMSHLYPIDGVGTSYPVLVAQTMAGALVATSGTGVYPSTNNLVTLQIIKKATSIEIFGNSDVSLVSTNNSLIWRFELNFIIS